MSARVRAFAPASVANLGVGFDVLGAALDGSGDAVAAAVEQGRGEDRGDHRRTRAAAARGGAEHRRRGRGPDPRSGDRRGARPARTGLELKLAKGLPLASGLGSSAASAAAGAKAAAELVGETRQRVLLEAVLRAENAADGAWHGDNGFASILGGNALVPSSDPAGRSRRSRFPSLPGSARARPPRPRARDGRGAARPAAGDLLGEARDRPGPSPR